MDLPPPPPRQRGLAAQFSRMTVCRYPMNGGRTKQTARKSTGFLPESVKTQNAEIAKSELESARVKYEEEAEPRKPRLTVGSLSGITLSKKEQARSALVDAEEDVERTQEDLDRSEEEEEEEEEEDESPKPPTKKRPMKQEEEEKDDDTKIEAPKKVKPSPSATGWLASSVAPRAVFDTELALLHLESVVNLLLNSPPGRTEDTQIDPAFKAWVHSNPRIVPPERRNMGDACLQFGQHILGHFSYLKHNWATVKFASSLAYTFGGTNEDSYHYLFPENWWMAVDLLLHNLTIMEKAIAVLQTNPLFQRGIASLEAMDKAVKSEIQLLRTLERPDSKSEMRLTAEPSWRHNVVSW